MPIYNQENIVRQVVSALAKNISDYVKEAIFIFDGCTDRTEEEFEKVADLFDIPVITFNLPNVNEVKSNNAGIKRSTCKYSLLVQDDCLIKESNFDSRILQPFLIIPNLIAVSGRDAVNARISNGTIEYYDLRGKDANSPKDIFYIRDVINRTPLLVDNEKMKEMEYFDEEFAPLDSDDADLSFRAYRKGYLVGSYWVNYQSPLHWGKTRNDLNSYAIWEQSMNKNHRKLVERHRDLIEGEKHSKDIVIPLTN